MTRPSWDQRSQGPKAANTSLRTCLETSVRTCLEMGGWADPACCRANLHAPSAISRHIQPGKASSNVRGILRTIRHPQQRRPCTCSSTCGGDVTLTHA